LSNQRKQLPKPSSLPTNHIQHNHLLQASKVRKKIHVTRSQTKKTSTITHKLEEDDIDHLLLNTIPVDEQDKIVTPKSALAKHYVSTGHLFTDKDFQILLSDQHRYRLLINESLLIREKNPKLNGTDRSLPLYIYPAGIEKKRTHTSKTNNLDNNTHPIIGKTHRSP